MRRAADGQTLVEYALLLALVVTVIMLVILGRMQSKVSNTYHQAANMIPDVPGMVSF